VKSRLSLAVLFSLALCLAVGRALAETPDSSGTLEVASYNVHGLPGFVTGDDTLARLKQISPRLRAFDVVGLQEDFLPEGHPLLVAKADQRVQRRFASKLPQRVYGSGLTTLARGKVLATREVHFKTFHGVVGAGADGLASKGFQVTRLQLAAGVELDLYNTHLDAGGSAGDSQARASQVAQITSALQTFSAGRAVLFLGDTNLKARRPRDAAILSRWQKETGLRCACLAARETCCGRIDRVLIRSGVGLKLEAEVWQVLDYRDPRGQALSDHEPIRVRLGWRRQAF
jgi:endonuclease/exonuclease/phosphatase family metal-dependent hydrolase